MARRRLNLFTVVSLLFTSTSFNVESRPINFGGKGHGLTNDEITISVNIVARPINVAKSVDYADNVIRGATEISNLAGIKSGGGKRHEFHTAGHSFGMIKNSGPSAGGKGHGFSEAESFGNIKSSGPAGGKGHDFPSRVKTLGNILNSGPSREGKGHGSGMDQSLVETTRSDQRFGRKGRVVMVSGNLWDLKNSGPSPGGKGH